MTVPVRFLLSLTNLSVDAAVGVLARAALLYAGLSPRCMRTAPFGDRKPSAVLLCKLGVLLSF